MDFKTNFIKDCIKLFLYNNNSFKNIQKESIKTPLLWFSITLTLLITIISTTFGLFISMSDGALSFLGGLFISAIIILVLAIYSIIFYGLTHIILKGFGSKIKFIDNFKLMFSIYTFGLTAWTIPALILGLISMGFFLIGNSEVLGSIFLVSALLALFGVYVWYLFVLINYLSKQNKLSKLKTFFAVSVVLVISFVLSLLSELINYL